MTRYKGNNDLPPALRGKAHLPALPALAAEVLAKCRSEGASLDDLVEILSRDEALSERLLQFANSALCELGTSVTTLERASLVLGMRSVQLMSLTFSLAAHLPSEGNGPFEHDVFWRRGLVRAVAGRTLAARLGSMTDDEAFLCGMLAEVGQMILADLLEGDYTEVLDASTPHWPTRTIEQRLLGFDHSQVTAALFEHWRFPEFLRQAQHIARLERLEEAELDPALLQTGRVLLLAEHVTDILTREADPETWKTLAHQASEFFHLSPRDLRSLFADLHRDVHDASLMLGLAEVHVRPLSEVLDTLPSGSSEISESTGAIESVARDPRWSRARKDPCLRDAESGLPGDEAFDLALDAAVEGRLSAPCPPPLGLLLLHPDSDDSEEGAGFAARIASLLLACVRDEDLVARLEDGTLAVLPLETSASGLRTITDRIHDVIEGLGPEAETDSTHASLCLGASLLGTIRDAPEGRAILGRTRALLARARSRGPGTWILPWASPRG